MAGATAVVIGGVEAQFRESLHEVGTEAWRTDLSDVILPLPVYDTSDSEAEGRDCGADAATDVVLPVPVYDSSDDEAGAQDCAARRPPQPAKKLQPWEEIPPRRVLELMRANEKHGHRHRELSSKPRPEPSAGAAPVRHLNTAAAARELDRIVGGGDGASAGEPVIIDGLAEGWRAQARWCSAEAFVKHYGDMPLKVHELVSVSGMGKGTELWLPARDYVEYAQSATTDAPFYVFQKKFIEGQHDELFRDYERPSLFADDLWDLTPKLRAGFAQNRFFCLGGERTGSTLHVDPHFTGAWNTLLCGEKRWVLFPPDTPPEEIGVPTDLRDRLRTPCAYWWHDWYPRLTAEDGGARLGLREVVQRAGETIYVPPGWWHAVLNHGWTIAVTENQLSPQTLPRTWPQLLPDRDRSARLARALRRLRPELLPAIGAEANEDEDGGSSTGSDRDADEFEFRMW